MTEVSSQPPTIGPVENSFGKALASVREILGRIPWLGANLSVFQTAVGLVAGLLSILGALLAIPNYFKPAVGKGEVVTMIIDAKTEKAVSNATVEILTLNNALVTTLQTGFFGKASHTVDEGQYRVRVKHPKFGAELRHVQVLSGQSAQIQIRLRAGAAPLREAERVIGEGVSAVKRMFGN